MALTITADNKTKAYGAELPELTVSYSGLTNGDTAPATIPVISTTATAASNVGTYPITLSGVEDSNYTVNLVNGTLTVTPVALTITADNKSKAYGAELPELTVSYSGLTNGDTAPATLPVISTTANAASNVGTYPITLSGAEDSNYTVNFVNGTLTINPVTLTITADNKSKVYGAAVPELTFTYSGLVNGDTAPATAPVISTTANAASNVGTYPITLSGAEDSNYTVNFVNGTLTINPVTLTITADNKSKVYGAAVPELTFTYSGLVNGDTAPATAPAISTTATASSNVGNYAINVSGVIDPNYTIRYVPGVLTVEAAALLISAEDKSKVYGAALPELTFTYTGLVNGNTAPSTLPRISTTATVSSNVGTYPITISGAADANYTITYRQAILTVTPAVLTIIADDKERLYKEPNPEFTFQYSGFVNGDTKIAVAPSVATSANFNTSVGSYPIILSGANDPNYSFNLVNGKLTILPRATSITWSDFEAPIEVVSIPLIPVVTDNTSSVTYTIADPSIAIIENGRIRLLKEGVTTITAVQVSDGNHLSASITVKITVLPAGIDSDGDGVPDFIENQQGTDPNDPLSYKDSDGDGVPDHVEIEQGTNPNDKNSFLDSNRDGVPDYIRERSILNVVELPKITVAWDTPVEALEIPEQVLALNGRAEFINFEVVWDLSPYNPRASQLYLINGDLQLPRGVFNPYKIRAIQEVEVQSKPAPLDLILDNKTFQAELNTFYFISNFTVVDPSDNIHFLELVEGFGDNEFFEIRDGVLFWSSSNPVAGKTEFQIKVRVTDRSGNVIEKVLDLTRLRPDLDSIEIKNSFTPGGDGINDTWGVDDLSYYEGVKIQVFDRGGMRIFYTTDPSNRWDGTYKGKELATGTYYYSVEIKEGGQIRRGFINLFR